MNLFRLVLGDSDRSLDLPFDAYTEERLADLLLGIEEGSPKQDALARLIVSALAALADEFIEPPTEKQLKYASAISIELGIDLPENVKADLRAMRTFLSEYAPVFRRKRSEDKRLGNARAELRKRITRNEVQ